MLKDIRRGGNGGKQKKASKVLLRKVSLKRKSPFTSQKKKKANISVMV